MKYQSVKLGQELRKFIMKFLKNRDSYPKLIDYLAFLWIVAENYKNKDVVNFVLIAQIIEEAFNNTSLKKLIGMLNVK